MSLFKQLAIMLTLFLGLILGSVMMLNFKSATQFVQNQLYSDAKNTAHSLGLSLSKVADPNDLSSMETMINAIYDSGYYERIVLKDLEGKILYERVTDVHVSDVPKWFIKAVNIRNANVSTDIMMGWSRFGSLEVSGHTGNAYRQVYTTFVQLLQTFIGIGIVVFVLLYVLLTLSLKSLKRIRNQAQAIIDNQFIVEDKIPFTTEFRSVTTAMNAMVAKVKDIFDRENETLQRYHELLYRDAETKLYNRRYLIATLPDILATSSGSYVMFSFDQLEKLKQERGYELYAHVVHDFAALLTNLSTLIPSILTARLNETDFFAIIPEEIPEKMHNIIKEMMQQAKENIEAIDPDRKNYLNIGCAFGEYGEYDSVKSLFSRADHVVTDAKIAGNCAIKQCLQCTNALVLGREEWRKELMQSLEDSRMLLASQAVISSNGEHQILHEEIFLRLKDTQGNIHSAGYFIPTATSLSIVDMLDRYMIEKVFERLLEGSLYGAVALNLSADFVKRYENVEWLKQKLEAFDKHQKLTLWFEVSNAIALHEAEAVHSICTIVKSYGHKFGIDHFILPESGAGYLQMIGPDYVKSNRAYLEDILGDHQSGESRESLINVITSLGISMIAIAIEDEAQMNALKHHRIEYFQGSFIAPASLV